MKWFFTHKDKKTGKINCNNFAVFEYFGTIFTHTRGAKSLKIYLYYKDIAIFVIYYTYCIIHGTFFSFFLINSLNLFKLWHIFLIAKLKKSLLLGDMLCSG
jgi:hypothetical protein